MRWTWGGRSAIYRPRLDRAPPRLARGQQIVIERDPMLDRLHRGEREAIILAEQVRADLVAIDEKAARQAVAERGLNVAGLLGILDEAAARGLIDLLTCVERSQQPTFRASPHLLKSLLDRYREAK
jgi:predicted nucleic acid-binding protein